MIANTSWLLIVSQALSILNIFYSDYVLRSSQPPSVVNAIIIPILLMRILRLRVTKHPARKRQSWEWPSEVWPQSLCSVQAASIWGALTPGKSVFIFFASLAAQDCSDNESYPFSTENWVLYGIYLPWESENFDLSPLKCPHWYRKRVWKNLV